MRPLVTRVELLPIYTVVNISAGKDSSCSSVRMPLSCPLRPMFLTQPHIVSGFFPASNSILQALCKCFGRPRLAGLYRQMTKSPCAAARNRNAITLQGVNRSEREITQKSFISGAPSIAAPAVAAVTQGTVSIRMSGRFSSSEAIESNNPAIP